MRHLDIIETTPEEYPFAQFYFTGSGGFNVKMRKQALKLGYSLNEYSMTNKKTKTPVKSLVLEKIEKKILKQNLISLNSWKLIMLNLGTVKVLLFQN